MIFYSLNNIFSESLKKYAFTYLFCGFFFISINSFGMESSALKLVHESCIDCHDEDIQKGNLRLDNLASLKDDPEAMHTWLNIYDKVESGKMPPEKKAFTPEEKKAFLEVLGRELSSFDEQKKKSDGRVILRRLSATEYKYAVQDLLHLPELKVKHYLPGDSQYHGIENVADRQQIAYNQIAQYLEAAETSLQAAVTLRAKPKDRPRRFIGPQLGAARKAFQNAYKEVGDKLILIKEPVLEQGPWSLFTSPSEPGYYKIRFKAHTAQLNDQAFKSNDRKTSPENLTAGKTTQTVVLGVALGRYFDSFDIGPESTIQECTVWLNGRERISLNCVNLPLRGAKFVDNKKPQNWDAVALEWFEIQGPVIEQWPSKGHQALFGQLPVKKWNEKSGLKKPRSIPVGTGELRRSAPSARTYYVFSKDPVADSFKLLKSFMQRAYRRPVSPQEIKVMQQRVLQGLEQDLCFQDAMLIAYKAILCSPDFLYIHERQGKLTSLELASRLAFYLWRSIPDAQLMKLALTNKLTDKSILLAEAQRMLKDPKADRFIDDFTNQWLNLKSIYATLPDKTLYPEYHEKYFLIESMIKETRLYIREMVKKNLPLRNVIDSDFTFLNESLAKHYGVSGVKGSHMRKVQLPKNSIRGGIITHGSMMKISANGFTTSPIQRGIWLLERVLGTPPPPPPPNAGSVEPDIRGAKNIRDQLAKHREVKSCANCHKMIDPPGFALEAFDVMGAFRTRYRSMRQGKRERLTERNIRYDIRLAKPVDATGIFSGENFNDIHSFKTLLLKDTRQVARNITERLVTQATGAIPGFNDRQEIEKLLDLSAKDDYKLNSIINAIITTPMFLEK